MLTPTKSGWWGIIGTDPDRMDNTLSISGSELSRTLCVILSKSGDTKETRNGMLEAAVAFQRQGLEFGRHAVAVINTGNGKGTKNMGVFPTTTD